MDTTDIPSGTYYIYAKIDDKSNAPRFSYSQGKIIIQRSGAPTSPTNLQTTPGDGLIGLTWNSNPESAVTGYRIYYSDNISATTFEYSLSVGNITNAELSGLANGRSYRVAVTAYDGIGRESLPSEHQIVSLVSVTSNNIPAITSTPVLMAKEYHPYSYDVDAQDADNDNLTYQLASAPAGMTINSQTGLIQWTPSQISAGNNYVEIVVEDSKGGKDTQHFYIFVETEQIPPATTASINPPANEQGWHNSMVAITLSAIDNLDGSGVKEIHYQLDTNPEVVTSGNQADVNVGSQGVHLLTFWAVDQAGNQESLHTIELKIDMTPPLLNMPTVNTTYIYNDTLSFNFDVWDTLSGIADVSATLNGVPISSGASLTLTKLGTNTFTLTATDIAGNTSTQTITFEVQYVFSGFLPPIQADGSKIFKLGSTIPVKFQLTDTNGSSIATATATMALQRYSDDEPVGDPIEVTSTSSADTGNMFRYSSGDSQYIYNLNTKGLSSGTWQIRVSLDDGTVKTTFISLK